MRTSTGGRKDQFTGQARHETPSSTTLNGGTRPSNECGRRWHWQKGSSPETSYLRFHTRKIRRIRPIGAPPSALRNECNWSRQQGPAGLRGKKRYDEEGNLRGYHQISRGSNNDKESDRHITRNSLYGVNRRKEAQWSPRARQQQLHRQMLYRQ